MDKRIVDFIAGLRAAGVRVSIAESEDAFLAARCIGIRDREDFRDSLRATLVKEMPDQPIFDQLFPLYFGSGGPPLQNLMDDMSPEEKSPPCPSPAGAAGADAARSTAGGARRPARTITTILSN